MLVTGLKTIENKGLEWKHTNNKSRKDYSSESSFPSLHWTLRRIKLTYERSSFLSSETLTYKEIMDSSFSCSVLFSLLGVSSCDISFELLPESIK